MRLPDRLAQLGVPGVSLALLTENEEVQTYTVGVRVDAVPVEPDTVFQAASIGKPVTALAALRLVGEGQLHLDEDVNTFLRSWKVPPNGAWQPRVTLRQLLSHTAGTTVHGFPGYPVGRARPTLAQVLRGESPANTPAVRVNLIPGTHFRYSGGGTTVVQQVLQDVLRAPFADLMRELVFEPLDLRRSTFAQPLPRAWWANAAHGHRPGGLPIQGGAHVYPEQAAAGLWTTPSDLARLARAVIHAWQGRPDALLTPALAAEMLTPAPVGPMGLGFGVTPVTGGVRFSHTGANEGYRGLLVAYPQRAQALVVLSNADAGDLVQQEVLRAVARTLDWPDVLPGPPAAQARELTGYPGRYRLPSGVAVDVGARDGQLHLQVPGQLPLTFFPLADGTFASREVNARLTFECAWEEVSGLSLWQDGAILKARRSP